MQQPQQPLYTPVRVSDLEVVPYNKTRVRKLSVLHMVMGVLCVVCELFVYQALQSTACGHWPLTGFWSGASHLLAGIVGVCSSSKASRGRVRLFCLLVIVSLLAAVSAGVISIIFVIMMRRDGHSQPDCKCCYTDGAYVPYAVLGVANCVQLCSTLWSASLSCGGLFCGRTEVISNTSPATLTFPSNNQVATSLPPGVAAVALPPSMQPGVEEALTPAYNPSFPVDNRERGRDSLPTYEEAMREGPQRDK